MTRDELLKKQEELDKEELVCDECGNIITWGEAKDVGCLECYYKWYKEKNVNRK